MHRDVVTVKFKLSRTIDTAILDPPYRQYHYLVAQ